MMSIMRNLEPILMPSNKIIYNELEEVNCVYFFFKGVYEIGYELNEKENFIIRYKDSHVIGAYEICYNTKCQVIFKTIKEC